MADSRTPTRKQSALLHDALIDSLTSLTTPNERTAIVAWLKGEAMMAKSASKARLNEANRMYRLGQSDALLLASDAIEAGDHLKDKP